MPSLPRRSSTEQEIRERTCHECGMLLDDAGEFHPYVFCVAKKAGRDPWQDVLGLGLGELPDRPPRLGEISRERMAEIMRAMEEAQSVGS